MKTRTLSLITMALGITIALPAIAQETMKYNPIMEKRADLRMQWVNAQLVTARSPLRMHRTDDDREGSAAGDRSGLVSFVGLSAKRADLRVRANQIGIEAAYDEWTANKF